MKKSSVWLTAVIFCLFSFQSFGQRFWVATTTGNWGDPANWSTTSGGAGGASVPGPGDAVTFNGARVGSCVVNVNPGTINGLTIAAGYTGSIDLNGFTLTTTGTNALTGGTINGASSTLTFNTTVTTTFSGTVFNVPLTGTTGRLFFSGGTFNSTVNLTKTTNADDDGTGNCTFAAAVAIQNNSTNRVRMANTSRDIFNGPLTITLNSTGAIELAHNSATPTQFNDNIVINYVNNAPARIGSGTGTSTLATTKTITVNPGAAGAGNLTLGGLTIASGQTIALTGNTTAVLTIRTGTTFNGTTSLTAPAFAIATGVFNGPLTMEKTGPSTDDITGGNTYGSTVNIVNSGNGQFNMAATNPDTYNGNVQIDNTGAGRVQIGLSSAGTVINGNLTINHGGSTSGINCILARNTSSSLTINGDVTLNQTNADASSGIIVGNDGDVVINGNVTLASTSGRGILFANGSIDASVTLGNGYSMTASAGNFTTGVLTIQRLTQLGTAAQNLSLTGNAVLTVGASNTFNGPVTFRAPQLLLHSTTFNNSAYLEKTGPGDNDGLGGAVFAGPTTIRNSGSGHLTTDGNNTFNGTTTIQNTGSDYVSLENTTGSTYQGPVEFNNSGSSNIRVARTGNTLFNDNIVVNSSSTGQILFCETTTGTSATLASGRTITTAGFTAGELRLQRFTQSGGTAQSMTFAFPGTGVLRLGPATTFNGNVTFSAPRLLLSGATYNGTADLRKTGPTNDDGTGGNVFMGTTIIGNSGSSYLLTASANADTFNGPLTINNNGSSTVRLADAAAGTAFNNNIVLNTSSGTGIYFGNGGGSSTLANDRTISAGSVLNGDIRLIRMVQTSSVNPQVLNLDGIAILTVGPGSQFGGDVDFRAPQLFLHGCTYGTTSANVIRLEKEGATGNDGNGGNVFHGTTTIVNSGSGVLRSANVSADIFNSNLTLSNTGTSAITLSYTAAGNQYNGNLTVSNVLGGAGISFGGNGGSSTLTPTGALAIGAGGFVSGDLRFARFTQTGSLSQSLVLTPPASGTARLRLGPLSSFGGPIDFRAPRILLEGVTFNDVTYIEKTGATDDTSAGGNVFNGTTTIANSGSGWFINADVALDQFNNDLTITNTGSAGIRMADNIPGTVFKGNIVVNSTFGSGIYFCETNTAATAQLDPTKTITVGGLGFTSGDLRLRRFTQLGGTAQSFTLTGTAGLRLGPNSTFNGNVNFRSPQLYINTGSLYNGTATLEKTGATDNTGTGGSTFMSTTIIRNSGSGNLRTNGGNTFNGLVTVINTGSNDVLLELTSGGTYNDDAEFINNGSSQIRVGYTGTTNFNGNIRVNSASGTGIFFGETATAINLASTKTISVGATGFSAGELRLQRFNQLGSGTPQSLTLTGTTAIIRFQSNTTFNSGISVSSPRVFFDGATFLGTNSFTRTSTSNDDSSGGNTFSGTTTFSNNGTGRMRLANTTADTYGNITLNRNSSGNIDVAYAGNNTFSGNITTASAATIVFGGGGGIQTFSGTGTQTITRASGVASQYNRLVVNKPSGGISLASEISIGVTATFVNGIITSSSTNFVNFLNGATASGASNASHVSGPVRKTGTDAFTFPVGKGGIYKSIAVGIRSLATDAFTAEYFNTVQTSGSTLGTGLNAVSGCEYWNLARSNGSATPTVTLSWKNSDCPNTYVVNTSDLRVASYNTGTTRWEDRGNGGVTGTGGGLPDEGTIVSSGAVNVFGAFALATATLSNPLPIELVDFRAQNMGAFVSIEWSTASETNNDYFSIQRSADGLEFRETGVVKGAGNSRSLRRYSFHDVQPLQGISYYRLRQTDFDGKTSYSNVVKIDRDEEAVLAVYPNPAEGDRVLTNIRGSFTVYNSVGQVVATAQTTNELYVGELASGVYLVKSASGQVTRLVIR